MWIAGLPFIMRRRVLATAKVGSEQLRCASIGACDVLDAVFAPLSGSHVSTMGSFG